MIETRAVSSEAPAERLIREGSEPMLMRAKSPTISRMDTTRMPTSLANKASLQEMQHRKRTSVDLSSGRKDDAIAAASAAIAAVGAARKLATIELSLKVSMGSTKKKVAFDANDSVLEARRVVAREFKVRLEEVCLFVSRTGIWLKDNRTLSSYELTDAVRLISISGLINFNKLIYMYMCIG